MDLQSNHKFRGNSTLNSFYEESMSFKSSELSKIGERKLEKISKEEKFKFNVIDAAEDFRGTLRNCDKVYQDCFNKTIKTQLWLVKPQLNAI